MKLAALSLHGFKSFPERTDIVFHEGITAIVGPNGCGKSNISDAVRWVLGEQRPTVVRGARMEEVIFQGTVNRRPINRGSVTLRVTNEDGSLPVPFGEVEIGRTVYRDGGSEYSINRATCRLRDVQELCRDTGLGANAYAIIESRMIDAILSERAEERRGLFEEAAGIGKYKDRSRLAGQRLARAELDLARLEDVIAEVTTKVRSLARQKGKAQRYHDLRKRRLSLEVAVVSVDLAEFEGRLTRVRELLAREGEAREATLVELRTAETERETSKVRSLEAGKSRAEAAGVLDGIQKHLVRWERDLAVARERIVYAERRLGQIGEDRAGVRTRTGELAREIVELRESRDRVVAALAEVGVESRRAREVAARARERLGRARATLAEVRGEERRLLRRVATLEGTVAASSTRLDDLRARLAQLERRASQTELALTGIRREDGASDDRLAQLEASAARARDALDEGSGEVEEARDELKRARATEVEAADRASALAARRTALQVMERDGAGYEPVIRAAREAHPDVVLGTLSQCISGPGAALAGAESYLGHLAQALLVRDGAAAARLRRWFDAEWTGGGGIVLLPLTDVPEPGRPGTLLDELRAEGPGASWVRMLLAGVDRAEPPDPPGENGTPESGAAGSRAAVRAGSPASVDARGVLVVGNPGGTAGLLERRGELAALEEAADPAIREASRAREAREAAGSRVERAEAALEERRATLVGAEDDLRAARADRTTREERQTRLARDGDDLARRVREMREAAAAATARARRQREELREATTEAAALRGRGERAAEVLEVTEGEWERARVEEARIAIRSNQHEGERARADERLSDLGRAEGQAAAQLARLDKEEEELGRELSEARALLARGGKAVEELFRRRDRAQERLARDDEVLERADEAVQRAERKVDAARAAERAASDRHHRHHLEEQELGGRIVLIRERVEAEWARPFDKLIEMAEPVEGDPDELKEELVELVGRIERLGPVNMLAIEEHAEQSERLTFLTGQRDDLERARNDLRAAIREIDRTATKLFLETFEAARENFRNIHQRLFQGGECDLRLGDPENPLGGPVDIHASPMGKKTRRIDLLSGGERALTALALLFGIYLVKPSPFCVLDEVDAPLDESNIDRFVQLLREFKRQSQFVVITHNPRTIEAADWIYGLTMEEPGVSSVVGVRLEADAST